MLLDLSIIIVNYNCGTYLPQCIASIYEKTEALSFEIIVVDNGSTDHSMATLQNQFQEVKLIYNHQNLGFGAANNRALKSAKGKYLLFLNPDTLLQNNALKHLYDFALKKGNILGCCGANLIDENKLEANIGGHFPSLKLLISDLGFRVLYPKYYQNKLSLLSTASQLKANRQIDAVCGAALWIQKDTMEQIGAFDEQFFLYFEDTDLCYRLHKAGYQNYIVPEAEIIHAESLAISTNRNEKWNPQKFKFFENGKQTYFYKHYGSLVVLFVKCISVLFVLSRWIAHRAAFKNYVLMLKYCIFANIKKGLRP